MKWKFDSSALFTIVCDDTAPPKVCEVRFPCDAEWERWAYFRPHASLGLFRAIRLDLGEQFNGSEAAAVIDRLGAARAVRIARYGEEVRIGLAVVGGTTEHVLCLPSILELEAHRAFSGADRPGGVIVAATAALYDTLHLSHSGYADRVPLIHKVGLIADLIEHIMSEWQTFMVHVVKSLPPVEHI